MKDAALEMVNQIMDHFDDMDADKNGMISKKELMMTAFKLVDGDNDQ